MSREPFVVAPSRNKILQAAWAGHKAAQKAEGKAKPDEAPAGSIPKENPVRSEAYRRLVASMPCKQCHVQGYGQAAHPPPAGKAIKQDDRGCFSLCTTRAGPQGAIEGCHPKFDSYKLMPHDAAVKQAAIWGAETRAEIIAADEWPKKLPRIDEPRPAAKAKRKQGAKK